MLHHNDVILGSAVTTQYTLLGLTSREAEIKLLDEAFQLENWGVCYVRVVNTEDNSPAYLGIGGFHIRLCNDQWRMVKK